MATLTVRALDEETKNRLRVRAAQNGHSMEQEARNILRAALLAPPIAENWIDRMRREIIEKGGSFGDLEIPSREHAEPRDVFDESHFKE